MKIKYSPCLWNEYAKSSFPAWIKPDTEIIPLDDDAITIDGQLCEFPAEIVSFDNITDESKGMIQEAKRINGELFLTIRRFYTGSCLDWDTGDYHEVVQ